MGNYSLPRTAGKSQREHRRDTFQEVVALTANRQRRKSGTARKISAESKLLFEACERRLVLSAQLLMDVLGDQALDMHGSPAHGDIPITHLSSAPPPGAIPIDSHMEEAHQATGWNSVQSQYGLTGKGQTVAVIDSGIAWDHVALGEGYGPGYRVVGGWDFTEENDAQPYDDGPSGFHGSHVSGIIGSDDPTHSGVAPDVDFVALRVFNDVGQGQLSWVEKALEWVHTNRDTFENPITTVNLSLGTSWNADAIPSWATLEDELQALYNDGIVVTASAGNSFQTYNAPGLSYPAASSYVLPVASVDDDGAMSDFSQRNARVIAAPGSNITSTVPDHVFGRDGQIDDYSSASGTSMAAPYVAGASVLVRQAMEMIGLQDINLNTIADHLSDTADSFFDSTTGSSYDRLNLENAIDALIPSDDVGDTLGSGSTIALANSTVDGWINSIGDVDSYSFTADASGTLELEASSEWLESLSWTIQSGGSIIASGDDSLEAISLNAGQTYQLLVSSDAAIGTFAIDLDFNADPASDGGTGTPPVGGPTTDLGDVRHFEDNATAGTTYRAQATSDGTFTVQWTDTEAPHGALTVTTEGGTVQSDSTWSGNTLRVDVDVQAGQWVELAIPGSSSEQGALAIANVVNQSGSSLVVSGSINSDLIGLNLNDGVQLDFGAIRYQFESSVVDTISVQGNGGNDSISIVGSEQSDKVQLRPTGSTLSNSALNATFDSVEEISYSGGGGPDRVYLYDSDQDDTLIARPGEAQLNGVGYSFQVDNIDRIFIHATGGGQDFAYLYDSSGDDRLSVRPQFSSMSGDGFFNYVRGFERVYAYASAGGEDQANLYDSEGDDRFSTSGASASIVGPGFSSFTRSFEQVNAYADAGGSDLATLYGSGQQTNWQQGADYVSFREGGYDREARGFQNVESYIAGQPHSLASTHDTHYAPAAFVAQTATPAEPTVAQQHAPGIANAAPIANEQTAAPVESYPSTVQFADTSDISVGGRVDGDSLQRDATEPLIEQQVLESAQEIQDWLSHDEDHISETINRFYLPEEQLLENPELEQKLLDEVFKLHDELF